MLNPKSQNQILNQKSNVRFRAYHFSLSLIHTVQKFPEKRIYWVIADQILRSATSIGANLIEAKGSSSKKDFLRYYEIALKSANETRYWLSLLKDAKLVQDGEIEALQNEAKEIANMIGSSLLTMRGKKD